MTQTDLLLTRYYAKLDGPNPEEALELVEPDVAFEIVLPSGRNSGDTREGLWRYVSGRPAVERRHNVIRTAREGDYESVYGVVTDDGRETGAFQANARLSESGKLKRYVVYFEPDTRLFGLDDRPTQG